MVLVCGIDESGRGPVIGPMVMCGVLIEEEKEATLTALGVKDSKQLTANNRVALVDAIEKTSVKFKLIQSDPKEIDAHVLSENSNLNKLEVLKTAEIINSLKPDKVYVDCPSNNIPAYTKELMSLLDNKKVELICAHKADVQYVSVGAASILAKVARDIEIEKIKEKIGMNFGSGYPSDPITVSFLKQKYKDFPDIFRKSWSSYRKVDDTKSQGSLKEFV